MHQCHCRNQLVQEGAELGVDATWIRSNEYIDSNEGLKQI